MDIKSLLENLSVFEEKELNESASKYLCVWDKDLYQGETYAFVDYDFFTDEAGYSEEDKKAISELADGEVYRIPDINENAHIVVKLSANAKLY